MQCHFVRNRDALLSICAGESTYDDLLARAQTELSELEKLFESSDQPELPDKEYGEGFRVIAT